MGDDERTKKFQSPRRNPQQVRPTPGVQKAIQTFGVRDLREILDKKRQEQGESQGHGVQVDKRPDPKQVKLPPPDPSYNYLKDPTRDTKPRPLQRTSDHDKPFERPIARDRETNPQQPRYRDERHNNRNRDFVPQERMQYRDTRHQENKEQYQRNKERHQEDKENSNMQEKGALKKNLNQPEVAQKKELRFSDSPIVAGQQQYLGGGTGGRRGSRGRNMRRGAGGIPREVKENKIENPFNIKIELSTTTGLRNCTLDEHTKISDIKHVPDQLPYQKYPRGGYRRSRGPFIRGRGRGRGNFRGRRGSYRGRGPETENVSNEASFNMEEFRENLPDDTENKNVETKGDMQFEASNFQKNDKEDTNQNEETQDVGEEIFERYDDYDQDEEYNDANENYDDEFQNEYYSEYQNESTNHAQNLDNSHTNESFSDSDTYNQGASEVIDQDLRGTITITSSKFQDGEVKRSIEVIPKVNEEENNRGNREEVVPEKNEGKV